MLVVGLTGGIGSGKSEVSRRFAGRGVPVVDTDVIARELVEPGSPALAAIATELGTQYIGPDGRLDRARLRDAVFADNRLRHHLEDILHPRIRERVGERLSALQAPYAIVVIPLLLETRYPIPVDRTLVVDCPGEIQLARVMARDRIDEASARQIIARQVSRTARLSQADDILVNNGNLDALDREVSRLHQQYLALADKNG